MGIDVELQAAWSSLMGGAEFSDDRLYRYTLTREVEEAPRLAVFIMLNPSAATATQNAPTVKRCIRFAKRWGYGHLVVVNIFAYRSPFPADLRWVGDPIGPCNDRHIKEQASRADLVLCAWGIDGEYLERGQAVKELLDGIRLHALGFTKDGHPQHPLYIQKDVEPVEWMPCGQESRGTPNLGASATCTGCE